MRLPEWNDLTNEQRKALVDVAHYNVGGTDAEYYAKEIAGDIYRHIREHIPVELPPLIAPLHAPATPTKGADDERV